MRVRGWISGGQNARNSRLSAPGSLPSPPKLLGMIFLFSVDILREKNTVEWEQGVETTLYIRVVTRKPKCSMVIWDEEKRRSYWGFEMFWKLFEMRRRSWKGLGFVDFNNLVVSVTPVSVVSYSMTTSISWVTALIFLNMTVKILDPSIDEREKNVMKLRKKSPQSERSIS